MRNTKIPFLVAVLLLGVFAAPSFGQQDRVFNWLPGNDESVRLDPANYHAGLTYRTFPSGGNIQVDIKSELPVTIFLTPAEEWNAALQHPETLGGLQQVVELAFVNVIDPQFVNSSCGLSHADFLLGPGKPVCSRKQSGGGKRLKQSASFHGSDSSRALARRRVLA